MSRRRGDDADFQLERDWSLVRRRHAQRSSVHRRRQHQRRLRARRPDRRPARRGLGHGERRRRPAIVIDLGAPIDVARVAIDPGARVRRRRDRGARAVRGARLRRHPTGRSRPLAGRPVPARQRRAARRFSGASAGRALRRAARRRRRRTSAAAAARTSSTSRRCTWPSSRGSPPGPSTETGAAPASVRSAHGVTGIRDAARGQRRRRLPVRPDDRVRLDDRSRGRPAGRLAPCRHGASLGGLQPAHDVPLPLRRLPRRRRYPGADRTFTTAPPSPTPTPTPTPHADADAGRRRGSHGCKSKRLTATGAGMFKVRVDVRRRAPAGNARAARARPAASGSRRDRGRGPARPDDHQDAAADAAPAAG